VRCTCQVAGGEDIPVRAVATQPRHRPAGDDGDLAVSGLHAGHGV